jgi:DNA replication protein DnaC
MEGDDGTKSLMMCDLLVLDDMGIEKRSEWLIEKLYQIIDYRWKMKKPMIVTSNIPLDKFDEAYSPQIKSRIYGMCKNIYM